MYVDVVYIYSSSTIHKDKFKFECETYICTSRVCKAVIIYLSVSQWSVIVSCGVKVKLEIFYFLWFCYKCYYYHFSHSYVYFCRVHILCSHSLSSFSTFSYCGDTSWVVTRSLPLWSAVLCKLTSWYAGLSLTGTRSWAGVLLALPVE